MGFPHIFYTETLEVDFLVEYFVSKSNIKSNLYLHYQNNNHNPQERLLSELLPKTSLFCS